MSRHVNGHRLLVVIVAAGFAESAFAQGVTRYWDGGGSNNNWSTAANWDFNIALGHGNDIVFAGTTRLSPVADSEREIGSITFDGTAGAFVISGERLTIAGDIVNNDADGQTIVNSMELYGAISAAAGPLTLNGTILAYGNPQSVSGAFDVTTNNTVTLTGGGLTKSGAGLYRLNAPLVNSGGDPITIDGGAIRCGSSHVLPDTVRYYLNVGGTLDLNGYSDTIGAPIGTGGTLHLPGNSAVTVNVPASFGIWEWPGQITGSSTASATFDGSPLYTNYELLGVSPFPGQYRLTSATLYVGDDERLSDSADLEVVSGTFDVLSHTETLDQVILRSGFLRGTGGGTLNAGSFLLEGGSAWVNLGGSAALTKTTGGTAGLYGLGTYSGGTFVQDGILSVQADDGLPINGPVVVDSPGRLVIGSGFSVSVGAVTGNGAVTINTDGTLSTASSGTWGPSTTGAGHFRKTGPDTLVFDEAQGYTGDTIVAGGTLRLDADHLLSNTGDLVVDGGIFDPYGYYELCDSIRLVSGSISNSSPYGSLLSAQTEFDLRSGSINATLTGPASLVKSTAGTVTLSGQNSYENGASILAGTIEISVIQNLNIYGYPLTFDGGTLRVLATTGSLRPITVEDGGGTLELLNDFAYTGVMTGVGTLTKSGPGRLLVQQTLTPGGLLVTAGEVEVSPGFAINLPGAASVSAGALLHLTGGTQITAVSLANAGDITLDTAAQISAPLINDGQITADGVFTEPLTNNSGGRIDSTPGGDLVFASPSAHTNHGEIVALGGQLEFEGVLSNSAGTGNISLEDAVLLLDDPFANAGTLTFAGGNSLVLGAVSSTGTLVAQSLATASFFNALALVGSSSNVEIEIGGATPGNGFGHIACTNAIALNGTLTLKLVNGFVPSPGSAFQLITAGSRSGTFTDVAFVGFPPSLSATLEYTSTAVTLHIGEPAVAEAELGVIYTKIPGHPTASVPGLRDLGGAPVQSDFRAMTDFTVSPDGSRWVLSGSSQLGSTLENVLLLGSGSTGSALSQEGRPIPGGAAGELFDFFSSGLGRFNTQNDFAYAARARGGVASVFQKVIVWNGVSQSIAFQMGDPYFNLQDLLPNPSGDETVGNSVGSIHILDDGTIGSHDSVVQNISTTRRPVLTYDRDLFQQTNVTTLTALGGVGVATWNTIVSNSFHTTPDGLHWLAEGRVNAAPTNPRVLVRDGLAVLQEGQPVAASGLLLGDISQSVLLPNGDWLARGRDNSSGTAAAPDWAVRNGALIARTGDPIFLGATVDWGDTLYAVAGNTLGDYVVAGNTTGPAAMNDVLVLNGSSIILSEGDPVDLDGNGTFDDDTFIGRGDNTLAFMPANLLQLTDDGVLYAIVNLRDGNGNDRNSSPAFATPTAFVRITLGTPPPPCPGERGDANCDGTVDFFDIDPFLLALFDPATYASLHCNASTCAVDVDCTGTIDFFDIDPFLTCVFSGCAACP